MHLRRVIAPAPGSFDTVLEMARRAQMADFDRARPLWEVTLVQGLEGDLSALVRKLHHALTDGVGGVEIAMNLFDLTRDVAEVVPTSWPRPAVRRSRGLPPVRGYDAGWCAARLAPWRSGAAHGGAVRRRPVGSAARWRAPPRRSTGR